MAKNIPKHGIDPFAELYPNVAIWVQGGWIEMGHDHMNRSFIRVLDSGGLIWEGNKYQSVHAALKAADRAILKQLNESS